MNISPRFLVPVILLAFLAVWSYFMPIPGAISPAQIVSSFTAAPDRVKSGVPVGFIWQLQGAGGYTFDAPCVEGVNIKPLACGVKKSSTMATNDYITLTFFNFSGGTKTITARLTPKDAAGADYSSGRREANVTVETMTQPITNFTAATTTLPGRPVTVSWSAQETPGVNLKLECKEFVKATSTSYTTGYYLPCDSPAFRTNLAPTGSLTLNFSNSSPGKIPLKIYLLPAITASSFDGTHAASIEIEVASDILPDPAVNFFTSSTTAVESGDPVEFSWEVKNAIGVNFKISCQGPITASSSNAALPCETIGFSNDLPPAGKASFTFNTSGSADLPVTVHLLPSQKSGQYSTAFGKSITLTVRPRRPANKSTAVSASSTLLLPTPPVILASSSFSATSPIVSPVASISSPSLSSRPVFTQPLFRGSKGAEVSALQEFLKQDPILYPEGIISGFFGPATERAVQRFQLKYNLTARGGPGYGAVGPKTRVKLNALQ